MTQATLIQDAKLLLEVVGGLATACTSLALVFPKGSKIGYWLAKIGSDLKGHTVQAVTNDVAAVEDRNAD